ncbi:MAG: peptide deformylase [Bacilli bacterium]
MIKQEQILDEKKDKILRQISKDVKFPIDDETKKLINDITSYLRLSQDEKYAKKHNIRPGMGLSFVQLGYLKRIFIISYKRENGTFEEYTIINPKEISLSQELIYVEEGEGCLSVNKEVDGIVLRNARISIEYYDLEGNKKELRVREEIAVAFQHEIDHLNGILFIDRIDNYNPNKGKDIYRAI